MWLDQKPKNNAYERRVTRLKHAVGLKIKDGINMSKNGYVAVWRLFIAK